MDSCSNPETVVRDDRASQRAKLRRLARNVPAARASGDSGWYVVQVPTGREDAFCSLIDRTVAPGVVQECFCPTFRTQRKVRGSWEDIELPLFPGYVIAVTRRISDLRDGLKGVSGFTKLLDQCGDFIPMVDAGRAFIESMTLSGDRALPMSMGFMEGDRVVVTSGPLVGREACIVSINRRKSLAFIEVDMFGRKVKTRIGLGIVGKKACQS